MAFEVNAYPFLIWRCLVSHRDPTYWSLNTTVGRGLLPAADSCTGFSSALLDRDAELLNVSHLDFLAAQTGRLALGRVDWCPILMQVSVRC